MSPNSIIFTVYQIKNYIVFEISWINTLWVWVWVWVLTRECKATMIISSSCFGMFSNSQWSISSVVVMDVMICIECVK